MAFSDCAALVKIHDPARFIATLLSPEMYQENMFSFLAFHIELSQIKKRAHQEILAHLRLQWWRDALEQIYSANEEKNLSRISHSCQESVPLLSALAQSKNPAQREFLNRMIDARENEFSGKAFKTIQDLERWGEETDGNLMHSLAQNFSDLCLSVEQKQSLKHLGIAWALAGLVSHPIKVHLLPGSLTEKEMGLLINRHLQLFLPKLFQGMQNRHINLFYRSLDILLRIHRQKSKKQKQGIPITNPIARNFAFKLWWVTKFNKKSSFVSGTDN